VKAARKVARKAPAEREGWTLRMRELCARTGVPRPVVHFYIREGLVPPGRKTGANAALYGDVHVARILLVRRLQHERFLPLKAIRALLEHRDEVFTPSQLAFLGEVKARLAQSEHLGEREGPAWLPVAQALAAHGLDQGDLDALVDAGLVTVRDTPEGAALDPEGVPALALWAALRAAGFTTERGFTARDLRHCDEAAARLVEVHAGLLAGRLERLEVGQAAAMLDRALPLISEFLGRCHLARARAYLSVF
jgi:DNA-binding transcriptional MerR regulator